MCGSAELVNDVGGDQQARSCSERRPRQPPCGMKWSKAVVFAVELVGPFVEISNQAAAQGWRLAPGALSLVVNQPGGGHHADVPSGSPEPVAEDRVAPVVHLLRQTSHTV